MYMAEKAETKAAAKKEGGKETSSKEGPGGKEEDDIEDQHNCVSPATSGGSSQ